MRKLLILAVVAYGIYWAAASWMENLRGLARWTEPQAMRREFASAGLVPVEAPSPVRPARPGVLPIFSPTTASEGGPPLSSQLAAEEYLEERKKTWGVQDYHELKATVYESPTGAAVKYQVYQDGLPIVGMEVALEFNPDHSVRGIENGYRPVRKVDLTQPTLSQDEILQRQGGRFVLDDASTAGVSSVLVLPSGSDVPELGYVMPVTEAGRAGQVVFRASDGQIIARQISRTESFKPR